jgi:hypothetical protein
MPDTTTTVPDSSTGATPSRIGDGSEALASLTPEQHQAWERTGEFPSASREPEAKATTEAKGQEEGQEQAQESAEPKEKGRGLKQRSAQLDKEIAELRQKLAIRAALREELAGLERQRATSAASPAAERTDTDRPPQESDFETYGEYVQALVKWQAEQIVRARLSEIERRQQAQAAIAQRLADFRAASERAQQRVREAMQADPALVNRVHPELLELVPASLVPPNQPIQPWNVVAEEIVRSDHVVPLLVYFSEHPDELSRIMSLQPRELLRAFGQIEAKVASAAAGSSAQNTTKTVSSAPPPPQTLKAHETAGDEVQAAIQRGDFSAYERAMNAREVAARK